MSQSLCSTCRSIDFRKYTYESRLFPITLGSWRRVSNRHGCLFCSLVQNAILSQGNQPSSKSIIKMSNKRSWKCCTSYNEYYGTSRMDYSNEFDLQAYALKTHSSSRYQFELYWEVEPGELCYVYLRPLRPGPFFGRMVDRDHADLALCRKWLKVCEEYHTGSSGQCLGKKTSRRFLQECLRLIDVEHMIIVRGSTDRTEYVALSYVWGEDKLKRERPPGWEMPRTLRAAVFTDEYGIETIELPKEPPAQSEMQLRSLAPLDTDTSGLTRFALYKMISKIKTFR
jgi:hypothetical protein